MPDIYDEAYDQEQVSSLVRALESAEQYSANYYQKAIANSHGYVATGAQIVAQGSQLWYYVESPSDGDGLEVPEPSLAATVTMHLHGYFNPSVDTSTLTRKDPHNLNSEAPNGFGGAGYIGDNGSSTVSDKGDQFYETLVGTGDKAGGRGQATAVAYVAPGDSLLMEIDNQTSSDGEAGFELPVIERTEEFSL